MYRAKTFHLINKKIKDWHGLHVKAQLKHVCKALDCQIIFKKFHNHKISSSWQ